MSTTVRSIVLERRNTIVEQLGVYARQENRSEKRRIEREIKGETMTSREQLIHLLTEAAEVEHNLLCSYLYAAFSLKDEGEGLSPAENEAVSSWRKEIIGVAIEEMGHLAMVNNILIAIGGAPHYDRPNLPVAPGYHPADFNIRLTPFDFATLDHFIYLERPQDMPLRDAAAFSDEPSVERTPTPGDLTPSSHDYRTIGEFYQDIRRRLLDFAGHRGVDAFLHREGDGQIGADVIDLPGLRIVDGLPAALEVLEIIIEQGEGATVAADDSHFTRFNGIKVHYQRLKKANPSFEPAHPAAVDPVMRRPLDPEARTWIVHPQAAKTLDLANAIYGFMLLLLEQMHRPGLPIAERKGYASAAMALMHDAATLGKLLVRLPSGRDGVNAGMTFAVPRHVGPRPNLSQALLLERLRELKDGGEGLIGMNRLQGLARAEALLEGKT